MNVTDNDNFIRRVKDLNSFWKDDDCLKVLKDFLTDEIHTRIDKEHAMSALKFSAEHARVSVLFHTKSDATTLR